MSISICRCCGIRASSSRIELAARSISNSTRTLEQKRIPPARDWGTGTKSRSTNTNGGESFQQNVNKWARPSGQGSRSGGGGERYRGGDDRSRGGGGQAGKGSGFGTGGGQGLGKWQRNDRPSGGSRTPWSPPGASERSGGAGVRDRSGGGFGMRNSTDRGTGGGSEGYQGRDRIPRQQRDSEHGPRKDQQDAANGSAYGMKKSGTAEPAQADTTQDRPQRMPLSRGSAAGEASEGEYDDGGQGIGEAERRRRGQHNRQTINESGEFIRGRQHTGTDKMREKILLEEQRQRMKDIKAREKREMLLKEDRTVTIPSTTTVGRLAMIFGLDLFTVQVRMQATGLAKEKQRADYMLTTEEAVDIALQFGFNPVVDDEAAFDLLPEPEIEGEVHPLRPPVVTIMGHVDHGKTTLLDALRNTAVAAGEAGGITQHIGAFSVPLKSLLPANAPPTDATITFLDTPGHAAFTGMRARGASVTDIVVLVVAADDGVMPQTKEVLELVKAEGDDVGLVVAINKIDKPGVDLEKVKSELGAEGIYLEEDEGDVQSVRVSGLNRIGLDNLVETLSTLAELRDLRSRTTGKAEGWVLESNIDKGAGRVATVLVTRGTLKVGTVVVAGTTHCKVRRMTDHTGKTIKSAGPGTPVVVSGWKEIPQAGDEMLEAPNGEGEARKVVINRLAQAERKKLLKDTEVINAKRQEDRERLEAEHAEETAVRASGGNVFEAKLKASRVAAAEARRNEYKELRLVVKGDVSGTVEAVEGALSGIGNKEAGVKIIHTGVGEVTDSDVALAEASDALIIGFNVPASAKVKQTATAKRVDLHLEGVIYRLIETVREKTAALLPPTVESRTIGEGNVIQPFEIKLPKRQVAVVAGSRCVNGTFNRNDKVRIVRGPSREQVYEGKISMLKHLKTEVDEVRKGMECGIQFEGFNDVKEGDEIVTFRTFEVPRKL